MDERKERMTLRNLLTMQSGLPWDETSAPFTSPENDVYQLNFNSSGGVQFTLDKPMQYEPGTVFVYNTGASHVLSGIIQEATGMQTSDFAEEYLFDPLGIQAYYWPSDTQGVSFGGFDLQLRPRDMAKFGFLYLNNGTWDDQQIISGAYVTESVQTVSTLSSTHGYGFQWHTMPDMNVWFTAGLYGQYIFVAPDQDLVAVFTSGYSLTDADENPSLLRNYILAAVTSQAGPDIVVLGALVAVPVVVLAVGAVLYRRRR
jgi:CubicO group peptidase (beta-lactamase class C family)